MEPEGNTSVSLATRIAAGVFSYETRPVLAVFIGPLIGLIYVFTLPVVVIVTTLYYLARRLGMNIPRAEKRSLDAERPPVVRPHG
jgi:hypothetical protein